MCTNPINAYKTNQINLKTGKKKLIIVNKHSEQNFPDYEKVQLPCGVCTDCRIRYCQDWSTRCTHEASLYSSNIFLTLTYSDEHLPPNGSLEKYRFKWFIEKLRRKYQGIDAVPYNGKVIFPIRYYMCGEYGEQFGRPHYHCCLFNFDFPDKIYLKTENGHAIYTSPSLLKLWSIPIEDKNVLSYDAESLWRNSKGQLYSNLGFANYGTVTGDSARYVAGYVHKKVFGEKALEHYVKHVDTETGECEFRMPEFSRQSRKPGIAALWFERKNKEELYANDYCTLEGKKYSVPRYYDKRYDIISPEDLAIVKSNRQAKAEEKGGLSFQRLVQKSKCNIAKYKNRKGNL